MENEKTLMERVAPYAKLALCAGLCIATAKTVSDICDDDDVRKITKKLKKAANVVKYMTGVADVIGDED
jgi:hypothetical protein